MEKITLFDMQTQDPVPLPQGPLLILFISLNDILILKDISKDSLGCSFSTIAVHVGPDSKKIQLWKTKEIGLMPIFFGGLDLTKYFHLKITELPSFLLSSASKILESSSISSFPKPLIRSLLTKYPEFKSLLPFPQSLKPSDEKALEQEVRIYQIEQVTSQTTKEIEELKTEFKEKDMLISQILEKIRKFEDSRKVRHSSTGIRDFSESEDYWTASNVDESVSQSVREPIIDQLDNSPKPSPQKGTSKSPVGKKVSSPVKKKK